MSAYFMKKGNKIWKRRQNDVTCHNMTSSSQILTKISGIVFLIIIVILAKFEVNWTIFHENMAINVILAFVLEIYRKSPISDDKSFITSLGRMELS